MSLGAWDFSEIQVNILNNQSGIGQLLGIGQDENGELYLLTKAPGIGVAGNSGLIYKIIPNE
jgi:hypothetical protein